MKTIVIKPNETEISVPDKSRLILVDNFSGPRRPEAVKERNLRLVIGRDCDVRYVAIRTGAVNAAAVEKREIILGDRSRLVSYFAYFGAGAGKLDLTSRLGDKSDLESRVFFYQSGQDVLEAVDNYIFQSPDSRGRFSVVGLLGGRASAQYYSDIVIDPIAQGTDSRIDMKLFLLDKDARGVILPGLKIKANEVKAGHGASTFQLSPDDLFYLQTRGLNEAQAKELLINSLAGHFLTGLNGSKLKKIILGQIAKKKSASFL